MIGFLWWCYDSKDTDAEADNSTIESQSFYGGILFAIMFGYILFTISVFGRTMWNFVSHPILEEVIACSLLVIVTIAAAYLLAKKHTVVFPLALILAIVAIHFFTTHYLGIILFEHCTPNIATTQLGAFCDNVASCCDWVLFLVAFVLYRKDMRLQNGQKASCR